MELDEYILRDIFRSLIILAEFDKEDLDFWENHIEQSLEGFVITSCYVFQQSLRFRCHESIIF